MLGETTSFPRRGLKYMFLRDGELSRLGFGCLGAGLFRWILEVAASQGSKRNRDKR